MLKTTTVASHAAIQGSTDDLRKVKRALISVSDKAGLVALGKFLAQQGVEILSTGGTAKSLRDAGVPVIDVADYTGSPEILDGRVKTLHPKIHGGLLGVRGNSKHEAEMLTHDIGNIDLLVLNLYPFTQTVESGANFDQCVENVDIGGPAMMRAASKNFKAVAVVSDPLQYDNLIQTMSTNNGCTTMALRRSFAAKAFSLSAEYDAAVATHFAAEVAKLTGEAQLTVVHRTYKLDHRLKYGMNPHQKTAGVYTFVGTSLPFRVISGTDGLINNLDAAGAWQLVSELDQAFNMVAAASFKHTSPAGAAIAVKLNKGEMLAYGFDNESVQELTDAALAYVRARNSDPLASFGDVAALSRVVDKRTAEYLKTSVSDGIIAPGYDADALAILKTKKGGNYVILEANPYFKPDGFEFREHAGGMALMQERNTLPFTADDFADGKIVTKNKALTPEARRDLQVASITAKYTQSNSIALAINGQAVGVGAGQQSRVRCIELAGKKATNWMLTQYEKVQTLPFKPEIKRQDRVNARELYMDGVMDESTRANWLQMFTRQPDALTEKEKSDFIAQQSGVALASDAFFPNRDNVEAAARFGVDYFAQPGGSVQDADVTQACDERNKVMVCHGKRSFTHG